MFILSALVKMINTNKDQLIQKEEIESFIQKQKSPSIFNDYFNSINDEINVNEFENQMTQIAEENYQKTGNDPTVEFNDKKDNDVKTERKKAGLTQEEFAMRSGLGLRFVRDLEQGKKTVRMDKVNQALAMFGMEAVPGKVDDEIE